MYTMIEDSMHVVCTCIYTLSLNLYIFRYPPVVYIEINHSLLHVLVGPEVSHGVWEIPVLSPDSGRGFLPRTKKRLLSEKEIFFFWGGILPSWGGVLGFLEGILPLGFFRIAM